MKMITKINNEEERIVSQAALNILRKKNKIINSALTWIDDVEVILKESSFAITIVTAKLEELRILLKQADSKVEE